MVKMVSLKKSAADRRAEKDALGSAAVPYVPAENEGVTVNLDHHHLMNMKVGGGLKSGHAVDFHGRGTVERSETRSTKDGERHSATLRLDKGGIEHEDEHERGQGADKADIRRGVESAYDSSAKRQAEKAEVGKGRAGKEVKETARG